MRVWVLSSRKHAGAAPPSITAVLDEAEVCGGLADYYALPARIVMGLVFRQYLDSMVLTPFEILHSHKLLRGLLEQTTLVENAMIRVSTVQARQPGCENAQGGAAERGQ